MEQTPKSIKYFHDDATTVVNITLDDLVRQQNNTSPMMDRRLEDAAALPHPVTPNDHSSERDDVSSSHRLFLLPGSDINTSHSYVSSLFLPLMDGTESTVGDMPPQDNPYRGSSSRRHDSTWTTTTTTVTSNSKVPMMDVLDEQFWLAANALDDWEIEWRIDYVASTSIDVLLGRGAFTNNHPGNVRFRARAALFRPYYGATSSKKVKRQICQSLVTMMKMDGARFLKKDTDDGTAANSYFVVHDDIARNKASQALREDPEVARVRRETRRAERNAIR